MHATATAFNPAIAVLEDYLDPALYPASLTITAPQQLYTALTAQTIPPEEHMIGVTRNGRLHVAPMRVVLCYNVMQGVTTDGEPWVLTFCNACNTGMVFDARVNGQTLHFQRRGAYEGMLMIWDSETGSYWQHITGECLYGASLGHTLRGKTVTRHLTAAEALVYDPQAVLWTTDLTPAQQELSRSMEKMRAHPELVEAGIMASVREADLRRPRFEMGLVVWDGQASCFYPVSLLGDHDNALLTTFGGRSMLVYRDPEAMSPSAVYLDAKTAQWQRDRLILDGGRFSISAEVLHDANNQPIAQDRPMQLLMRWYGAASTFAGCAVWEG